VDNQPGDVVIVDRIEHMFDETTVTPLEATRPGAELARLLEQDPAELSGYDLVSFLGATERLAGWAQSRQLDAIRELGRRRPAIGPSDAGEPGGALPDGQVSEFAANEIAAELRLSLRGAQNRLTLALSLDRLPGTRSALSEGRLDLSKVRAIADATAVLDDAAATRVELRVLDRAGGQTVAQLRASLGRAVLVADPRAAEKRHQRAVIERRVELQWLPDGMAAIYAPLPADAAVTCHLWLTGLAERAKGPDDDRTLDQRRADALADLAQRGLEQDDVPRRHGRRVRVQVAVAATTLLGLDNDPAELSGYGPITADIARELAGDATWQRILTDPRSGAVLDVGRTTYRPPQAMADYVIARDKTCRGPGCRIPSDRCELDHTVPYPIGRTAVHNLGCGCKHCHRMKHQAGWQLEQLPDATFVWIAPTGHRYVVAPEPFLDPPAPPRRSTGPPGGKPRGPAIRAGAREKEPASG
jgi:hypothetical protein